LRKDRRGVCSLEDGEGGLPLSEDDERYNVSWPLNSWYIALKCSGVIVIVAVGLEPPRDEIAELPLIM
jgi:hypothetical protein